MRDEFLTLIGASKALVTFIDKEFVFDRAAAGGCSGIDYYQSDGFYDLIVDTRKVISEVENGLEASDADNEMRDGCTKLFEIAKALIAHIEKTPAFDKVNDMGPIGIETYQSDNFKEVIQKFNDALQLAESGLEASE